MRVFAFLNVDIPWIAWLVYRGEMVSPRATGERVLSVWHAKYLIDAARAGHRLGRFRRELEIDGMRQRAFPTAVSRLSGLYFFEDIESARKAGTSWDGTFREEHLAEVEVIESVAISRYDSEWISRHMDSEDSSWIPRYLAGQARNEDPLWELLVDGRGLVLGTEVRQRAYDTVKRVWPKSLGLLELSRVAVELHSDLGLIAPILTQDGNNAALKLYLNFQDAKREDFLRKLAAFDGPKNTVDLNAQTDLVVPDLRGYFVQFRLG